ncbi:MAG: hypothetical protein FWG13_06445 [Leptospirales bacterium]|nr:hypothetical protein [Leptospirales bacterium]
MKSFFCIPLALLLITALPCVLFSSEKLRVMKTVRFEVYYPDGLEKYALSIASAAERAYIALAEYIGHELTRVLPIYIHHEDIKNALAKKTYYPLLKYSIDIRASEKELTKEITRQMTYAFQYDVLFNDKSGNLMNRNSCALVDKNFLKGMAEYMASRENKENKEKDVFFYDLEKSPGAAGEILRDARDYGGLEKIPRQNAPPVLGETESGAGESIFDFRESVFEDYKAYPAKHVFRAGFAFMPYNVFSAFADNSFADELESWVFTQKGGLVKKGDDLYPEMEAVFDCRMFTPAFSAALYLKKGPLSAFEGAQPGAFPAYNYGAKIEAAYPFAGSLAVFAQTGVFKLRETAFGEAGAGLRVEGVAPGSVFFGAALPVSGAGASWNKFEFSLRPRLAITEWLRAELGVFYGRVFGKDAEFSYYAGGFNLRAAIPCEYSNNEILLLNPEIVFAFPGLKLPFPLPLLEAEFVLFSDIAWMRKSKSGADAGAGLRFIFYPLVTFKLDFVRMIDKKVSEKVGFAVELSL